MGKKRNISKKTESTSYGPILLLCLFKSLQHPWETTEGFFLKPDTPRQLLISILRLTANVLRSLLMSSSLSRSSVT